MRRNTPPERISPLDVQRTVAGIVSLFAGVMILARLPGIGFSPVAVVTGLAFLAFGVYRLTVTVRRYQEYSGRSGERHG